MKEHLLAASVYWRQHLDRCCAKRRLPKIDLLIKGKSRHCRGLEKGRFTVSLVSVQVAFSPFAGSVPIGLSRIQSPHLFAKPCSVARLPSITFAFTSSSRLLSLVRDGSPGEEARNSAPLTIRLHPTELYASACQRSLTCSAYLSDGRGRLGALRFQPSCLPLPTARPDANVDCKTSTGIANTTVFDAVGPRPSIVCKVRSCIALGWRASSWRRQKDFPPLADRLRPW